MRGDKRISCVVGTSALVVAYYNVYRTRIKKVLSISVKNYFEVISGFLFDFWVKIRNYLG